MKADPRRAIPSLAAAVTSANEPFARRKGLRAFYAVPMFAFGLGSKYAYSLLYDGHRRPRVKLGACPRREPPRAGHALLRHIFWYGLMAHRLHGRGYGW